MELMHEKSVLLSRACKAQALCTASLLGPAWSRQDSPASKPQEGLEELGLLAQAINTFQLRGHLLNWDFHIPVSSW